MQPLRELQPLDVGTSLVSPHLLQGAPHSPLSVVLVGPGDASPLLCCGWVECCGHLQSLHGIQLPFVAAKPRDGVGERGRAGLGCGMGWAEAGWRTGVGLGVLVRLGAVGVSRKGCRQ